MPDRAPVDPAVLHRIRTGEGQCTSTCDIAVIGNTVALDQCLDAAGHQGDHEGFLGAWPQVEPPVIVLEVRDNPDDRNLLRAVDDKGRDW